MLQIVGLKISLGNREIIKNISFSAKIGDIIGFIGPNGAGKTTTMRMICGILEPDEGEILINNIDIWQNRIIAQKHIGYLAEGGPLYGEMSAKSYLEFLANMHEIPKDIIKSRIIEIVSKTQLKNVFHQKIETLSKGYKRRVALAGALLHNPDILILDEPTDGLDPNQKINARNLISDIGAQKITIISTHILEEVTQICNRVILINEGKIIIDEAKDDFVKRAQDKHLDYLFNSLTTNIEAVE